MSEPMSLSAASKALREAMRETVRKHSLWYILQGVLMMLAGVAALLYPLLSAVAVAVFLGWLLVIVGIVQGLSLIGATRVPHFWIQLLSVVLCLIIGFLFVRNPEIGVDTLTLLLIVFFLVGGVSRVVFALTIRPLANWGWLLASGIVGILLSAVLLSNPAAAIWLLGVLIGIQLLSEGAALAWLAWQIRRA